MTHHIKAEITDILPKNRPIGEKVTDHHTEIIDPSANDICDLLQSLIFRLRRDSIIGTRFFATRTSSGTWQFSAIFRNLNSNYSKIFVRCSTDIFDDDDQSKIEKKLMAIKGLCHN